MAIFIHYLACIVCVQAERVEALFCQDFWVLFILKKYQKRKKKNKNVIVYKLFVLPIMT